MHSGPQRTLDRLERVMRERIAPSVHTPLASVALSAWEVDGEPVAPREALGLDQPSKASGTPGFLPFKVGSPWGSVWGTTWFRISGTVRDDAGPVVELVIDLGWFDHSVGGHCEGLIYRPDGTVVKALHPRNGWVRLSGPGAPPGLVAPDGSVDLYLEAAANPLLLGLPPFIRTPFGEQGAGADLQMYTLERAEICEFRTEVWELARDLEVAGGLAAELSPGEPRYWRLLRAVDRALDVFDGADPGTATGARAALAGVLSKPAHASAHEVTAVGHAHIDSAWLWPMRETQRKLGRTVANVLALMDSEDDFVYTMSAAQHFSWLEDRYPDLFARVERFVRAGRFVPVGGMWVEPDGVMPTGESLVRQLVYGKRYFRDRFAIDSQEIWLPDSFGYSGALPQLARRAGYRWFLTQKISWNDTTSFPHHSFFWQGIDGTRVFTHFPPADTYAAEVTAKELHHTVANFRDKAISSHSLLAFGYGDGGGGPTREMTGRARRFADLEGAPRLTARHPAEFFELAEAELLAAGTDAPVWSGELYLELHRGTLTSQAAMKRGNRRAESLLRTAEYLSTVAALSAGAAYPTGELAILWKAVLLNQFHDILPGTSIAWVHREARDSYRRIEADAQSIIGRAIGHLPGAESAAPGVLVPVGSATAQDWRIDRPQQAEPFAVVSADGAEFVLQNAELSVRVDADGHVVSLHDRRRDREIVPAGHKLGLLHVFRDEPVRWDAWDLDWHSLRGSTALTDADSVRAVRDGNAVGVTAEYTFGASRARTTIWVRPGRQRLDMECEVDWQERDRFLAVSLPLAITSERARFETQYGFVERPVHSNTAADEAQYESCTHRYVHVAEAGYGVGVVNDSTYGGNVTPLDDLARGVRVRLSLLRSPRFPDPDTDRGTHRFRWAVVPAADQRATLAAAYEINAPALSAVPDIEPLIALDHTDGIAVVDWIKLADDDSGDVIARIYEPLGGRARASLRTGALLDGATVRETNLLEDAEVDGDLPHALVGNAPVPVRDARLVLAPFQVATLRFQIPERRSITKENDS